MSTPTVGFTAAKKNSRATTHLGWYAGGTLKLYTASRPADADTAITNQTLLATFTLPNPAGTVSGAVITFSVGSIAAVLVVNAGTAAWARYADSNDTTIADMDVGATGSGAALMLDNVNLVVGGLVSIVSLIITEG